MNFMDWMALGAASGAYAEASRARSEVEALWVANQRLQGELETQKWVEELIYRFDKIVTAISSFPANPVNDFIDIVNFLRIIEENKLDTSCIRGIENKEKFEQTLEKSHRILEELESLPQVQDHIHQQEQAISERNQRALEQEQRRLDSQARVRRNLIITGLVLVLVVAGIFFVGSTTWVKAMRGDSHAQLILGEGYYNGDRGYKDFDAAFSWIKTVAEKGHSISVKDDISKSRDYASVVKWSEKGAQDGFEPEAAVEYYLGQIYYHGLGGIEKDYNKAAMWFERSASKGFEASVAADLGKIYYYGLGGQTDYNKAAMWFERSASKGSKPEPSVENLLGEIYYAKGDYFNATKHFKRAAEDGDLNAQLRLGRLYYYVHSGVQPNFVEAAKWFYKAASEENANAQLILGRMYAEGHGVPRDYAEALRWLQKAVANGLEGARFEMNELEKKVHGKQKVK